MTFTGKNAIRQIAGFALASAFLATGLAVRAADGTKDVVVFAAASLKNALDDVANEWRKETGSAVKISYAASSVLAKQIEQDAPAQIFLSADTDWMDYVAGKGLIRPESRTNLLGNRLVLIAPKSSATKIDISQGFDLAKALGDGRLAVANVAAVPAGKYGKSALEKLGAWTGVANKIAEAENVRAALLLVSRGEAPLGIVYQTDATSDPSVKIIATFPDDSHPAIIYPMALTTNAGPQAAAFAAFIRSEKTKSYFEAQGFSVLH
jgi:molybdate transport system substrate-binding protein